MRSTAHLAVAAASVSLLACDAPARSEAAGWAGTVDTLVSGRVVVRNPDVPIWGDGEAWTLEELLRIGVLDGVGPAVFGRIGDVELGPQGEVYVLDGQAEEVRVFGADGTFLRTLGRPGQGPGELSRAGGMALDPTGTLWIMNWSNSRYTGFDPGTGALVGEPRRLGSFAMFPWPGRFDRAGRLLDVGLNSGGDVAILVLDTALVPADTLAMPQVEDRHRLAFRRNGVMAMSMMQPFAPQPVWAPHPGGGIVAGEGEAYRLHRITPAGDTTVTVEVLRARVPVSRAERDSALAAFAERTEDYAGGLTPDGEVRVAEAKPAHGSLFVDDREHIWVRAVLPEGAPAAWDVIDPAGRLLGQVPVPEGAGFTSAVRGDRMAIVSTAAGFPEVVVYRLRRPGPP